MFRINECSQPFIAIPATSNSVMLDLHYNTGSNFHEYCDVMKDPRHHLLLDSCWLPYTSTKFCWT